MIHSIWLNKSIGPYVCIAKSFALQEMRLVIARLVLKLDMSFPPNFDVAGFRNGIVNMRTTVFEQPLLVKPTKRSKIARSV